MAGLTLQAAREKLRDAFKYDAFRPGQENAVEAVLQGRDTLVVLPTGGGKSLCFQVPALMLPKLTVVISPLISLMKDQVDTLVRKGQPAAFINSSLTSSQVSDRMARAARGEIKLLYVAPERFESGSAAEQLRKIGVSLLAIDEAHCISQWGHDFRPSYLRVKNVREQLGNPPVIALTATATPEVRKDIVQQLALDNPHTIITGFDRTNLTYFVIPARNDADKDAKLIETLRSYDGLAVVYASTRKSVERIAHVLQRAKISAAAYHAGLDDQHRQEVQEAFMTEKVRAIVATNAFGMGIDKPNVRLVVHHSMPGTLEAYYQEAGRAGRDGQHSNVFLIHSFQDRFTHEYFIKGSYPEKNLVEAVYKTLQNRSDKHGIVSDTNETIAASVRLKCSERDVESAIRVLQQGGAVSYDAESYSRVNIRLIASPDRIKNEITGEANPELGLLRALWRVAGNSLNTGVTIDLDGLPPGIAANMGAADMLDSLQNRQFLVWERTGGGLALTARNASLDKFRIDWANLDRRRRMDLSKLEAVQKYAYTKYCRRGFVLRYFEDPAARQKCEGCDNCLGITAELAPKTEKTKQRKTKHTTKVVGMGGSGFRSEHIPQRPRSLAERGSSVSETSETRNEAPAEWSGSEASARGPCERRNPDPPIPLDDPVFTALRELRLKIAHEEEIPAYIVFPNKTLTQIALNQPSTLEEFAALHGIGPHKTERYGKRFIEEVARVTRQANI